MSTKSMGRQKQPNGVTFKAMRDRARTDGKVLRALREHGELTRTEVSESTGLSDSTVWLSMGRLMDSGKVREVEGSMRRVPRGNLAHLYELGDGRGRKKAAVIQGVHRHPQDVALFGEYERRAA